MDLATNHEELLRCQASRRLLKHLFAGHLEQSAILPLQTANTTTQDYMGRDAFDDEASAEEPN